MRKNTGNLYIVSAPSGAGKSTLCKRLVAESEKLEFSVSHTTRAPREGEVDGKDYIFVSEARFREMAAAGEFLEWAEVHGNLYGTSLSRIRECTSQGVDLLLDIDVQGAKQIRTAYQGAVYIFILPPSLAVLRERLEGRMSNSAEDITRRLSNAAGEIRDFSAYDYVIVNDALEEALSDLKALLRAERARTAGIDPVWIEKNFSFEEDA